MSIIAKIKAAALVAKTAGATMVKMNNDLLAHQQKAFIKAGASTTLYGAKAVADGYALGTTVALVTKPTDRPVKKLAHIVAASAVSHGIGLAVLSRLSKEERDELTLEAAEIYAGNIDAMGREIDKILNTYL